MFFASFHFFILRITINCNYLFTKHFNYKTLIYLCQRPSPKFIVFLFVQEAGGERRLCGFASGGCVACSGRLRRNCTKYQATMLSCSASSGKPDSNSPDCIVAWYFCGVSWYLHDWDIRYRRCFLGCGGICMAWIFAVADAFWGCCGICMTGIFAVADAFFPASHV